MKVLEPFDFWNKISYIVQGSLEEWSELIDQSIKLIKKADNIYLIGNGASSTMADHYAADMTKNGGVKAHTFNLSSRITSIGNDIGFDNIFSENLKSFASNKDLLIAISSSGNSENIIKACAYANKIGMEIITLSGFYIKNNLISKKFGTIDFYIGSVYYGVVECTHNIILHMITDKLTLNKNKE